MLPQAQYSRTTVVVSITACLPFLHDRWVNPSVCVGKPGYEQYVFEPNYSPFGMSIDLFRHAVGTYIEKCSNLWTSVHTQYFDMCVWNHAYWYTHTQYSHHCMLQYLLPMMTDHQLLGKKQLKESITCHHLIADNNQYTQSPLARSPRKFKSK
jgi:hypothetical protein